MFSWSNNTGENMTLMFAQDISMGVFQSEETMNGVLAAFYDLNEDDEIGYYISDNGTVISECFGTININQGNQTALALWGDDRVTDDVDGLPCGAIPSLFFLSESNLVYKVQVGEWLYSDENQVYDCGIPGTDYYCQFVGFAYCTNGLNVPSNISLALYGCTDVNYTEYNENADLDDGSCTTLIVYGCLDNLYTEYNELANTPDESCSTFVIEGCTDSDYTEYIDLANTEDGSCFTLVVYGCTDDLYTEYYESVNSDNGSCTTLIVEGCMDILYLEYSENANTDDGSCVTLVVLGCQDVLYTEYNDLANTDDESCLILVVEGCTNDQFIEYTEIANTDDGSCYIYINSSQNGNSCAFGEVGVTVSLSFSQITPAGQHTWDIQDTNGNVYATNPFTYAANFVYTSDEVCLQEGGAYIFNAYDSGNDGWGDGSWYTVSVCDGYYTLIDNSGFAPTESVSSEIFTIPSVSLVNGSCIFPICSDPNYLEYYFNLEEIDIENSNTEELCTTPITSNGITASQFEEPLNTGANMTIPMPEGMLQQFEGGQIAAFSNGICVGLETITSGFIAMGLWGDDSSTETLIDGMLTGEVPSFAVLFNGGVISLDQNEMTGYTTNGIATISNFQITEPIGCTSPTACNYVSYAIIDDGSCTYAVEYYDCEGTCILDSDGDGICNELEIPGCTVWGYNNYNELATDNDGTCLVSWEEDYAILTASSNAVIDSIENDCANNITIASATLDSLQNTYNVLSGLSISIDLLNGWNIIGYTSTYEQDAQIALAEIEDIILIFKDNNADVYMPEYGFNGIGNLLPGQGYQIKVSEAYNNFSFENELILGCTDSLACNYNELANLEDTNCTYVTETTDCDGNLIALNYTIGDLVEGGIVFYIDETGEHGLVAALEDLGSYEWGCYGTDLNGNDNTVSPELYEIGAGYENSIAIVAECSETPIAASVALSATTEGYTDWYLPSRFELVEMYNSIGNGGPEGNIGGFETSDYPYYWSSSEYNSYSARYVSFNSGATSFTNKSSSLRVRAVRAF
jgi:hypothetical protein